MAKPTEPSAEKRPTPATRLKAGVLDAWFLWSLVLAGAALVALIFGIDAFAEWLAKKATAMVGPEGIGLALGGLLFLVGALGLVGMLSGRLPPRTTRSQKVVTLAVTAVLVLLGGMLVIAALAGWY